MTSQAMSAASVSRSRRVASTLFVWGGSAALLLVTLAVLAVLAWMKYREFAAAAAAGARPEMPVPVVVASVSSLAWRNSTSAIGTVLSPHSISLNNELPGTVAEVRFEPGGIVEKDQVLVLFDTSVERAQLEAAMAREKFAASTLKRNRQLAGSEAITELELEELESQWSQAQAQVSELQAIIERKTIKAPFRARVGLTELNRGQYLAAGSLITSLQGIEDYLHVDFMLPQGTASQVEIGQPVELTAAGRTWEANLLAIDAQADRGTRNVRARVRVANPPVRLLPGDSVQVRIEYGPRIVLPAVPADAVRRSPQGAFVFVIEETAKGELRADERPVIPAAQVGGRVGIASGVVAGDRVAAEGSFKLQDGSLVMPAPGLGASQAASDSPTPAPATAPEAAKGATSQ